jgi:nitrite reductase (NO-forming)
VRLSKDTTHGSSAPGGRGVGRFDRLRPVALAAAGYALTVVVWIVFGTELPGGRWFAVHLFTLGVVTNLVLGLSDHFARALTHRPGAMPWWQLPLANTGILAVLWSVPSGAGWVVAAGATLLTVVVFLSYARLRSMRRAALAPRFAWVVRAYERAHGAFLHGAVLGALLGASVFGGAWIGSARLAHAHVNLLGWAGMTLLATIVFFGPTVARTRIEQGSDARAARAFRHGATALTLGVLALLLTGASGALGVGARGAAAAGLAVFAASVTVVCLPVARAMRRARAPDRWAMLAAVAWFPVVAWADVLVVATASWRSLDALGAALLVGVLAQAIAASLGYLAPQLRPRGDERDAVRGRVETLALGRAVAWNAGVLLVVGAALAAGSGADAAWCARVGWGLVLGSAISQAILILSVRRGSPGAVTP